MHDKYFISVQRSTNCNDIFIEKKLKKQNGNVIYILLINEYLMDIKVWCNFYSKMKSLYRHIK